MRSILAPSLWTLGLILLGLALYAFHSTNTELSALRMEILQLVENDASNPRDCAGSDRQIELLEQIKEQTHRLTETGRKISLQLEQLAQHRTNRRSASSSSPAVPPTPVRDLPPTPSVNPFATGLASEEISSPPTLSPETQAIIADVIDRHMRSAATQSSDEQNPEKLLQLMQDTDAAIRNDLYLLLTDEEFQAFYQPLQMPTAPFPPPIGWGEAEP